MGLARKYGMKDIAYSAGGCCLIALNFCKRLEDLVKFENQGEVKFLQYSRNFRISERIKLIVGRSRTENELLETDAVLDEILLKIEGVPGPSALLTATSSDDELKLSASICARYSDANKSNPVTVCARYKDKLLKMTVYSIAIEQAKKLRI